MSCGFTAYFIEGTRIERYMDLPDSNSTVAHINLRDGFNKVCAITKQDAATYKRGKTVFLGCDRIVMHKERSLYGE